MKSQKVFIMRTKTMNNKESVMLLFTCKPLYEQYHKAMTTAVNFMAKYGSNFVELTFEDPKGLFLDNKVSEPTFMELEDIIINLWTFKAETFLKSIKWNLKLVYYCEKQFDRTVYHIIGQKASVDEFKKVYGFKSWSVYRNLTKKERTLVYKFINGYFKNKYSWNYLYYENLLDDIENLKQEISDLEGDINELSELLDDSLFLGVDISDIKGEYIELLDDLKEAKTKLKSKRAFEDKLLYSISDEPTTLGDYGFTNSED